MIDRDYRLKQLELLDLFTNLCDELSVQYFLMGGTLLGAIREGGFIDNDYDMDIAILRKDLDKLMDYFKKNLLYPFFFEPFPESDEVYYGGFYRIRNASTTQANRWELLRASSQQCCGIWLDICVLDDVPRKIYYGIWNIVLRFFQGLRMAKSYYGEYDSNWCISDATWKLYRKAADLFSVEYIDKKLNQLYSFASSHQGMFIASFSRHKKINQTKLFRREWFLEGRTVDFEGRKLTVPQGAELILTEMYGKNYMAPIEKKPSDCMIFCATRSCENYHNILDESAWRSQIEKYDKLVVFGSGQQANLFFEESIDMEKVLMIIDNNPQRWGGTICGKQVYSPDKLIGLGENDSMCVVIATIHYLEIADQLDKLNIKHYCTYVNSMGWNKK